jgi:hypothetical protein
LENSPSICAERMVADSQRANRARWVGGRGTASGFGGNRPGISRRYYIGTQVYIEGLDGHLRRVLSEVWTLPIFATPLSAQMLPTGMWDR